MVFRAGKEQDMKERLVFRVGKEHIERKDGIQS